MIHSFFYPHLEERGFIVAVKEETVIDMGIAEKILQSLGEKRAEPGITGGDLIPLLQAIQDAYGYLPHPVLSWLSGRTGIPLSRMYGVVTFYTQFYLEPRGRHTIRCCQGTACHVKGGKRIAETIAQVLDVEEGGNTSDMRFTFETVACLGTCFLAPVIMVNNDYYGQLTPDRIEKILESYK